jgi:hypothetical protein
MPPSCRTCEIEIIDICGYKEEIACSRLSCMYRRPPKKMERMEYQPAIKILSKYNPAG